MGNGGLRLRGVEKPDGELLYERYRDRGQLARAAERFFEQVTAKIAKKSRKGREDEIGLLRALCGVLLTAFAVLEQN